MSDDNDGGISLEGLIIPFRGFWFEILKKSIAQNEKVFGVRSKQIGVNSILYNVPSLGFKAVERLHNSADIEEVLWTRAKNKKCFNRDGQLLINLALGRGKVGNLITGEFLETPPDPEEVVVGYSPARRKKNSEISEDSKKFPSKYCV